MTFARDTNLNFIDFCLRLAHPLQVEDRKKAIMDAEKERREYILRKNQVNVMSLFLKNIF